MPEEETANPGPAGPDRSAAGSGPSRGKPPQGVVAQALAEVEQTLQRLKAIRAERAESEARFRAEIERRDALEAQLKSERDEAVGRLSSLETRAAELESQLGALSTSSENRVRELTAQHESSAESEKRLEQQINELRDQLSGQRVAAEELERRIAELAESSKAEIETAGNEVRSARDEARLAQDQAEHARQELDSIRRQADEARERAAAVQSELESAHQDRDGRAAQLQEALDQIAFLETLRAEDQQRIEALGAAAADSGATGERLRNAEQRIQTLEADIRATQEAAEQTRRAGDEKAAQVARLEQQLADARNASAGVDSEQLQRLQSELDAAQRERDDALGRCETSAAELDEFRSKLDAAAEHLEQMGEQLREKDLRLADLESGSNDVDAVRVELELATTALREVTRERDALAAELRSEQTAQPPARDAAWTEQRRARLRRCRSLLRARVQHAAKRDRQLQERLKQCDDVLARRRELVEARSIIEKTHRKLVAGRARSSSVVALFLAVCVLAFMGAASWVITDQFVPATYAASAVVAAEFPAGTAEPGSAAEWQAFHEKLLLDPQLMSRVSERMATRGFPELSAPAAVKAKLDADMSWSSPEPGQLVLELRGEGRERNARMLDTYASTLVLESNGLRQRRQDAAQTVMAQRPQSGVEPLEDPRPQFAALGGTCAALFGFLLWFGIWSRMVKAKAKFEQSAQIDHLLEDAGWVDPIQQIINARGEGAISEAPGSRAA